MLKVELALLPAVTYCVRLMGEMPKSEITVTETLREWASEPLVPVIVTA
jgi:hypothetical protein